MADTSIAAQWQQSIDQTTSALAAAQAQQVWARAAYETAKLQPNQTTTLTSAINALNTATQQVLNLTAQLNYSVQQRDLALQNTPNTDTNTAPANPNPGNNVTIQQPATALIENTVQSIPTPNDTRLTAQEVSQSLSQEQLILRSQAYTSQLDAALITRQQYIDRGDVTAALNLDAEIAELARLKAEADSSLQNLTATTQYAETFARTTLTYTGDYINDVKYESVDKVLSGPPDVTYALAQPEATEKYKLTNVPNATETYVSAPVTAAIPRPQQTVDVIERFTEQTVVNPQSTVVVDYGTTSPSTVSIPPWSWQQSPLPTRRPTPGTSKSDSMTNEPDTRPAAAGPR